MNKKIDEKENRFEGLNLVLYDEIEWDDTTRTYNVATECWFDVDKVFGTDTNNEEDVWVNFYILYDPRKDMVYPLVHIDRPSGIEEWPFFFTEAEQEYVYRKFLDYCVKREDGVPTAVLLDHDEGREETPLILVNYEFDNETYEITKTIDDLLGSTQLLACFETHNEKFAITGNFTYVGHAVRYIPDNCYWKLLEDFSDLQVYVFEHGKWIEYHPNFPYDAADMLEECIECATSLDPRVSNIKLEFELCSIVEQYIHNPIKVTPDLIVPKYLYRKNRLEPFVLELAAETPDGKFLYYSGAEEYVCFNDNYTVNTDIPEMAEYFHEQTKERIENHCEGYKVIYEHPVEYCFALNDTENKAD